MGYRNYFYIAERKDVDDFLELSHEDQIKVTSEMVRKEWTNPESAQEFVDEYIQRNELGAWELLKYLNAKEIHGCGKYFDNNITNQIKEDCIDLSDEDSELCFIKPEALMICAEHYKEKTISWWQDVIHKDNIDEIKEEIKSHTRELVCPKPSVLNNDIDNKFNITSSWSYEYAMFELVHLYKSIDWDKYSLIWCGY